MQNQPVKNERKKQEHEAQQQFINDAIHDNAYRYSAAAQKMLAAFRREHANDFKGDWRAFDTAQEFLTHANEDLRRLMLSRCALLALSAALPKNRQRKGLLTKLSHACWQLMHYAGADNECNTPVRKEQPETLYV
jgi:hypothetical protein